MTTLCARCGRREREPGLLMCRACVESLVGRQPLAVQRIPEWRKRASAKDLTGWQDAA